MTTEEQDALVGRVIRESKDADAELSRLLTRADQYAQDIKKLSEQITLRVSRAKAAGKPMDFEGMRPSGLVGMVRSDAGIEHIRDFAGAVDLAAIEELDRQIAHAVAAVLKLREQRDRLGL